MNKRDEPCIICDEMSNSVHLRLMLGGLDCFSRGALYSACFVRLAKFAKPLAGESRKRQPVFESVNL